MRFIAKKQKPSETKENVDDWSDISIVDEHKEEQQEFSTEIKFEISAEPYDSNDKRPMPKAAGFIKGATKEAVRWALGTIIAMFIERRLNHDDDED
jgi:hypothetical protein